MENLLRKCILAGLLVAFALASCRGPAGQPTPTPFSPTPATVFAPPFFDKTVQIAWFYKAPTDGDLAVLAAYFDVFVLTHKDETARDTLRAMGVTAPFLQYFSFDAIRDPGTCTGEPYGNQVAYEVGDFCALREQHPDWFLLDANGQPLVYNDYYLMDPGNLGWRAFFLERVKQIQDRWGWNGVFLDNVEASLYKRQARGLPAIYPDVASYQEAIAGFVEYLYTSYFQPQRRPLFANVIAIQEYENTYFRYLQYLDGAMEEGFAVDFDDGYLPVEDWEEQMNRFTVTQQLGKRVILVSNGTKADTQRQLFAFASYLLIADGRASFRYANNQSYEEAWAYSDYLLDLGEPLGPRYYDNGVWQRDFAKGSVSVDPQAHTAAITTY